MSLRLFLLLAVGLIGGPGCSFATSPNNSAFPVTPNGPISHTETFYENASGSPLVPLFNSAKSSIDIEIYEMDDTLVLSAIKNAIDRGVRLRILKEPNPVGGSCKVFRPKSSSDSQTCIAEKNLLDYVTNHGSSYLPFNKDLCALPGAKCFQHGKMVIIDQEKVMLSTGNFNTSSLCAHSEHPTTCNRDYSVVSSDPKVVQLLKVTFEKDLTGVPYDLSNLLIKYAVQKITISPYSLAPLLKFIGSAKRVIRIQNQYLKDPDLNNAILAAAARGVEVQVMISSACSFNVPSVGDEKTWTRIFTAFDQAGIKSRIFTRSMKINQVAAYLHAKAIVVDDARAWVGSVNGSTTSLTNNREYGIFIDDLVEVQKLNSFMETDFVNANSESWQESLVCKKDPQAVLPPSDGG
ncbi:MAG: hypothetical protein H7333_08095 [Bdellovibrionales bacterium]|nr:hypothetical protein [Oligoflexia bacterium]